MVCKLSNRYKCHKVLGIGYIGFYCNSLDKKSPKEEPHKQCLKI